MEKSDMATGAVSNPDLRGSARASAATTAAFATAAPAAAELDMGAGRQPELALGYDCFAGFQAVIDHQVLVDARAGGNRPHFDSAVLLHDVHKLAILAGLHRLVGNHDRIRPHRQPQRDTYELARPEFIVLVLESALQLDGAGGGVHRIVDEGEDTGLKVRDRKSV